MKEPPDALCWIAAAGWLLIGCEMALRLWGVDRFLSTMALIACLFTGLRSLPDRILDAAAEGPHTVEGEP